MFSLETPGGGGYGSETDTDVDIDTDSQNSSGVSQTGKFVERGTYYEYQRRQEQVWFFRNSEELTVSFVNYAIDDIFFVVLKEVKNFFFFYISFEFS